MTRIAAFLFAIVTILTPAGPASAEVAEADRSAMQSAITDQIEAFQRDDGPAAYDFASPMIRDIFPTPEAFMSMVQNGYQPVYRPQSFAFGPLLDTERGPVQRVFITGPDGASYVAEYLFQRQPDGSWRINGVTLIKDTSPTI